MFLTRMRLEVKGARQLTLAAACGLVAIATCTTALALRMDVNSPPAHGNAPTRISVRDGLMVPETKKPPVYPEQAKKDRVQGKVVLAAVIAKDGSVAHLSVVSGPSALQRSALDAVRQWRYKPYLLNGNPIEVDTRVQIVYTLAK